MPHKKFPIPGYPHLFLDVDIIGDMDDDNYEEYVVIAYETGSADKWDEVIVLSRALIGLICDKNQSRDKNWNKIRTELDVLGLQENGYYHDEERSARLFPKHVEFKPSVYDNITKPFIVEYSFFDEVQNWIDGGEIKSIDLSKYPHTCPKCKQRVYIGFQVVEHMPNSPCVPVNDDMGELPF